MRILMLAQFYPPIMGGEERHVQTLSRELVCRGHSVAVATLWHEGQDELEDDQGVRIYRIRGTMQRIASLFSEGNRRHVPPFPDPELSLSLREIIVRERPEIVHAHNWLVYSFLPLKAWSGAKLILTLHDYSLVCVQKRLMYRGRVVCDGPELGKCLDCAREQYGSVKGTVTVLGNRLMGPWERKSVDVFLPVSQAVAVKSGLIDGHTSQYYVVPNFIPDEAVEDQTDALEYLNQLPEDDYILFVGDLTRDKGVDVLLEAYAGLPGAPPLVLIGRRMLDLPSELPSGVSVLGPWPHHAILHAWSRSLFGVLPSVCPETFGIVVLEAMASGRPVVASRIGGLPDVVCHPETGLLVPPGDAAALREALCYLMTDTNARQRMGVAARQRAEMFRASKVVPRVERIYERVLDENPPDRAGCR